MAMKGLSMAEEEQVLKWCRERRASHGALVVRVDARRDGWFLKCGMDARTLFIGGCPRGLNHAMFARAFSDPYMRECNDMPWAQYDKVLWVQDHFPDIAVHFGPYSHDKQHHCRPGDILVDDRLTNCIEWRAVGGTAYHVANRDVIVAARALEQNFQRLVESAAELQAQLSIF